MFGPSWTAVARSWSRTPQEQRDQHFFATLDFEDGSPIFQRVRSVSYPMYLHSITREFSSDFQVLLLSIAIQAATVHHLNMILECELVDINLYHQVD